jgi:hypothetical protein
VALPIMTKSLKGITAKRANAMLALTGRRFWQEESYDPKSGSWLGRSAVETADLAGVF